MHQSLIEYLYLLFVVLEQWFLLSGLNTRWHKGHLWALGLYNDREMIPAKTNRSKHEKQASAVPNAAGPWQLPAWLRLSKRIQNLQAVYLIP